jgi:hypothetical protein
VEVSASTAGADAGRAGFFPQQLDGLEQVDLVLTFGNDGR